ncbi:helix-turn-helix domain-containing protein [Kitasatospora sp. NPDC052896]|uniref:helix-turn-helix domain-containing protein n=1 Tax=Kitasatospora sp. NPDC052896 TaxID=3364061 RepID=UPI0037C56264
MATRPVEIGPTGLQTAKNIERLRTELGMSQRRLAEILTDLGRPTPTTALSKIERGERRVDVDDLAAIAVALGVSPATLLLPPVADASQTNVTGAGPVTTEAAWDWADGISPLLPFPVDEPDQAGEDGLLTHALRARPEGRRTRHLPPLATAEQAAGAGPFSQFTRVELVQLLDSLKAAITRD